MFLSDKLIQIGQDANTKNNLSQVNQAKKILAILKTQTICGVNEKHLLNVMRLVVRKLNDLGFKYYTVCLFFDIKL